MQDLREAAVYEEVDAAPVGLWLGGDKLDEVAQGLSGLSRRHVGCVKLLGQLLHIAAVGRRQVWMERDLRDDVRIREAVADLVPLGNRLRHTPLVGLVVADAVDQEVGQTLDFAGGLRLRSLDPGPSVDEGGSVRVRGPAVLLDEDRDELGLEEPFA